MDAAEADRIARAFFTASRDGDTTALASLLATEAERRSDGGGRVLAYPNVIRGLDRLLRLFAGLTGKTYFQPVLLRTAIIDGLPGYVSADRGGVLQTTALEIGDGRITAIYMVRNPDKLRHVAFARYMIRVNRAEFTREQSPSKIQLAETPCPSIPDAGPGTSIGPPRTPRTFPAPTERPICHRTPIPWS